MDDYASAPEAFVDGTSIDVHAHVGRTVANGIGQSVDQLIARMDSAGISHALPSPAAADRQVDGIADTRRMNDIVAEAVREHPNRFPTGFGLVEPRHEDSAVDELVRVIDELGLAGISVHPMLEGYYLDVPLRVDPLFEVLDDRRALCLMHCSPDPGSGGVTKSRPGRRGQVPERHNPPRACVPQPPAVQGLGSECARPSEPLLRCRLPGRSEDDRGSRRSRGQRASGVRHRPAVLRPGRRPPVRSPGHHR